MTYCIVNKVTYKSGSGFERFLAIGIPDGTTAEALMQGLYDFETKWNEFSCKEEPYQLKAWDS